MDDKPMQDPESNWEVEPAPRRGKTYMTLGFIIILLAVIGFMYHSITKKNTELAHLRQENILGEEEQKKLNSYINEITDTVNEVEAKLREVRSKQVTITGLITQAENDQAKKTRLMNDISAIEDQLRNDRRDIANLEGRMKKSAIRIKFLEDMVTNLQNEIGKNERIMADLRSSLEEKDQVIKTKDLAIKSKEDTLAYTQKNLRMVVSELEQTNQVLDETRNTGYFVIGVKKELIQKKVIEESGGFLQRKNLNIAPEFDSSAFTKIHIAKTTEFPLSCGAKDVKLLPPRSETTYQLEETGKSSCVLKVLNTEQFWKMPYLVVLVKG
jgi:ethanolamine utilization microcompartment shell protein EutS